MLVINMSRERVQILRPEDRFCSSSIEHLPHLLDAQYVLLTTTRNRVEQEILPFLPAVERRERDGVVETAGWVLRLQSLENSSWDQPRRTPVDFRNSR